MYLFDTNIFLEVLLGQEQAAVCEEALNSIHIDAPGWVTAFSVHAIEAVLGQNQKRQKILEGFLEYLEQEECLSRYETTLEEERKIFSLVGIHSLDFDDALQYFVAKKLDLSLVTLDKDFQKVIGIHVLAPGDLVKLSASSPRS